MFCHVQGNDRQDLIKDLHRVKTDLFMDMVESKQLPLRPGVKRLVLEAFAAGLFFCKGSCKYSHLHSGFAVIPTFRPYWSQ